MWLHRPRCSPSDDTNATRPATVLVYGPSTAPGLCNRLTAPDSMPKHDPPASPRPPTTPTDPNPDPPTSTPGPDHPTPPPPRVAGQQPTPTTPQHRPQHRHPAPTPQPPTPAPQTDREPPSTPGEQQQKTHPPHRAVNPSTHTNATTTQTAAATRHAGPTCCDVRTVAFTAPDTQSQCMYPVPSAGPADHDAAIETLSRTAVEFPDGRSPGSTLTCSATYVTAAAKNSDASLGNRAAISKNFRPD